MVIKLLFVRFYLNANTFDNISLRGLKICPFPEQSNIFVSIVQSCFCCYGDHIVFYLDANTHFVS